MRIVGGSGSHRLAPDGLCGDLFPLKNRFLARQAAAVRHRQLRLPARGDHSLCAADPLMARQNSWNTRPITWVLCIPLRLGAAGFILGYM